MDEDITIQRIRDKLPNKKTIESLGIFTLDNWYLKAFLGVVFKRKLLPNKAEINKR